MSQQEFDDTAERELAALRVAFAGDLMEHVAEYALSGSRGLLARRLRDLVEAEQSSDISGIRGAVFELALASVAYGAALDHRTPKEPPRKRRHPRRNPGVA